MSFLASTDLKRGLCISSFNHSVQQGVNYTFIPCLVICNRAFGMVDLFRHFKNFPCNTSTPVVHPCFNLSLGIIVWCC